MAICVFVVEYFNGKIYKYNIMKDLMVFACDKDLKMSRISLLYKRRVWVNNNSQCVYDRKIEWRYTTQCARWHVLYRKLNCCTDWFFVVVVAKLILENGTSASVFVYKVYEYVSI